MEYFDGLTFSVFDSVPQCTNYVHNEPRYYGIQFNYSGPLQLCIDHGTMLEVNGPYVFLTYPGRFFEYGPSASSSRNHNYICTYGPRIQKYIDGGLWNPDPLSPLVLMPHPKKFLSAMQELMALLKMPRPPMPRAVHMFEELLLQIHEAENAEIRHVPYQAEPIDELIRRICDAPELNWNFEAEAEKIHVTLTHFRRIFKELAGLSPQQFLIQMRLNRGAELLKSSSASIGEIASLSGWENVFYFSRMFHRKFNISPRQYRKEFHS